MMNKGKRLFTYVGVNVLWLSEWRERERDNEERERYTF